VRRLRPYPAYKGSGIDWLGEIPAHWQAIPLKRIASIRYGLGEPPEQLSSGLPFIRATNVSKGRIIADEMQFVDPEDVPWDRDPVLRSGDIIVVRSGAYTGDSAIIPPDYNGAIAGYDMVVRRRQGSIPQFIAWALLSHYVVDAQIKLESLRAAQPHLNAEELGAVVLLIPPCDEQRAIATFLSQETTKIDALVAKEEQLIARLQEKRTALITGAVTKGLDPNVPMTDSGVEWLGEVPADWELLSLKRRAKRIQTGSTPATAEQKYYEDVTIAWYGPGSFSDNLPLQEPIKFISGDAIGDGVARLFDAGSVVVVTIGATIGKVAYMAEPGSFNQQITGITFDLQRVWPRFGAYQLKSLEPTLRGIAPNTTLPILDQEEVGYLTFLVPRLSEQYAIVAFLDRETARIDAMVAKVREAIDRLKELRIALISAAVTGKIDVREEAA
jgi:type I restriction enzyme S subunit